MFSHFPLHHWGTLVFQRNQQKHPDRAAKLVAMALA